MTTVTKLTPSPDRSGRFGVSFSDGTVLRLYRQTLEDYGLYPGIALSDGDFRKLKNDAEKMSAKMRAVRIVSATSVSKKELERRLVQKGENPNHAAEAVQWMADMHLVDDAETARQIVSRAVSRGYGINRARQMLYEKRIPKEYWDEALKDYPEQDDEIIKFLAAKLPASPTPKDVRKVIAALMRRGHNYGEIRRGLEKFNQEVPEDC